MSLGGYGHEMMKSINANKRMLKKRNLFSKNSARYKDYIATNVISNKALTTTEKHTLERRICRLKKEQALKTKKVIVTVGFILIAIIAILYGIMN